jgi:hypothetical protein
MSVDRDQTDDWQRRHAERVELLLARIDEALCNLTVV